MTKPIDIPFARCTRSGRDLSIEASTAGLQPGVWPHIVTVSNEFIKMEFAATNMMRPEQGMIYRSPNGIWILTIWND